MWKHSLLLIIFFNAVAMDEAKRADREQENECGETALHRAATKNDTEKILLLLKEGASIEANGPGYTPLEAALFLNKPQATYLLIEQGALVSVKNKTSGKSPCDFVRQWYTNQALLDFMTKKEEEERNS